MLRRSLNHPRLLTTLRFAGLVLGLSVLLILLASTLLLTSETARLGITQALINKVNTTSNIHIAIDGLTTPNIEQWQVEKLIIERDGQTWFDGRHIKFHWQSSALLDQVLIIKTLSASNVSFYSPLDEQKTSDRQDNTPQKRSFPLASVPLHAIQFKTLAIGTLSLHGLIPDEPDKQSYNYSINADAKWQKDAPLSLNIEVRALNETSAKLTIQSRSNNWNSVSIEGSLQEDAGGFFGQLLQLPKEQEIAASFDSLITVEENRFNVNIATFVLPLAKRKVSLSSQFTLMKNTRDLYLDKVDVAIDETKHTASGSWIDGQLNIDLNLNQFPLDLVNPWVTSQYSGDLTAQILIQGTMSHPTIQGKVTSHARYNNIPITVDFIGSANKDELTFDRLNASLDEAEITAVGRLDINGDTSTLELSAKHVDVNLLNLLNITIPKELQATITTAQATLHGSIKNPQGKLQLSANGQYKQQPFVLSGDLTKTMDTVVIKNSSLTVMEGKAKINGQFQTDSMQGNLNVSANAMPLTLLELAGVSLPDTLTATISTQLTLKGTLAKPSFRGIASIQGHYQDIPFNTDATGSYQDSNLQLEQLTLHALEGEAQIRGAFHTDTLQGNLNINANAMPLTLLKLVGVSLPETLMATVNTQLNLKGTLAKPAIKGEVSIHGKYQDIPFNTDVTGSYHESNIQLERLRLHAFDEEILIASGSYQAQKLAVNMEAKQLPPSLFSTFGWQTQQGDFNANVYVHGSLEKPLIDGVVFYKTVLPSLDDQSEEKPITFSWELNMNTEGDSLNLASTFKRDSNTPGGLLLKIPTAVYTHYFLHTNVLSDPGNIPLQATINGAFDLQILSFLLDSDLHRLRGGINTDFALSGTLRHPKIEGSLKTDKASYENTITGTTVNDINCSITMQQTTLRVDTCKATDGSDGSYAIDGEVQLPLNDGFGRIILGLQASSANILRQPNIEGEVTGKIDLTGNFKALLASGKMEVSPFTTLLDSSLINGTPHIDVEEVYGEQTVKDKPHSKKSGLTAIVLPSIQLDLLVTASRQAYLRGHGLNTELLGEILIKGDLKNPHYEGTFETVRGNFEIFGKKFKLEKGQVTFTNNNIALSIPGVYEKNDIQIRAEITGTNDDITLSLSAIPTMQEDEILAFIIFGKSLQKITPFEAIQLANAVQTLRSGGGGFFDPIGKTRDLLGVDTLSVEAEKTDEGGNGVNVGIGKYLNEKVYLELERTPNPSQPWKGNLEIELTPNVNLESSTGGATGIEGAQIKWKRDY
ncbi:MAG: translocation/assembly module TamB domain-containing protein [Porticoccus sp.]|nr:translocation/assembly module TamB domain-containing protein [Porticoccus sp.]